MNIQQKVTIKMRQMSVDNFLNQKLQELTSCLLLFIQTKKIIQKGIRPNSISYQNVLSRIIMSSSTEKTSMTTPSILI